MTTAYFSLAGGNFSQNWEDRNLITANDDWSLVPSIMGYLGDYAPSTSTTGIDPRTLTSVESLGAIDVIANLAAASSSSGGVAEIDIGGNNMIALQGSGSADAPGIVLFLDATGRQDLSVSFNVHDLDGTIDNAVQPIAVQYRIGESGAWTDLPAGYIADATEGPSLARLITPVSVELPASVNGQSQVQVRILTTNAPGNDEWVGLDNISVTSNASGGPVTQPGILSIDDVSVAEGDSGAQELTFTVTRANGDDGAVGATWTIVPGTATAADLAPGQPLTGTISFLDGQTTATITVLVAGDMAFELNESFAVNLSAPTGGASLGDASGTGTIENDDPAPSVQNVWINEINYDPAASPDTGEFIELAGLAGVDLTGWSLVFYNGNGGASYRTVNLAGSLSDATNGFGFLNVPASVNDWLQNGSPDGIALVDNVGRVVQFLSYEGTMTATNGPASGMTSTDIGVFQQQAPTGTSLQLTGTGSSYSDFTWAFNVESTTGAANAGQTFLSGTDQGVLRIASTQVVEGQAGTANLVFTVTRSGGFATATDVEYTLSFETADADDLVAGTPFTGTVHFEPDQFTATITIPVVGDTLSERNETLFVTLGAVTGNAVVDQGQAVGTITNDDRIALTIMEIQGESHTSPYNGQPIATTGIVTVVDTNGFYLQDPTGDGNVATSDAIFVYTGSVPTVAVGDAISLSGSVTEFGFAGGLTTTEITGATWTVTSTGNALPAAVLVGTGGRTPPTESIDSDGLTIFNPSVDGIDFWESLEGMRVTIDAPLVVSNTNVDGETMVVASLGEGATGVNDRGGITISPGDYNPEMIQLDDRFGALTNYTPNHSIGDQLADVTGVIGYSNDRFELLVTDPVTVTTDVTLGDNNTTLASDANSVTIATYNLENLDPGDMKYDILALDIVYSLGAPDIIAVQEIQDPNGAGTGGTLSGAETAQGLIDAIYVVSGIQYAYVEIAPTDYNSTGGEPNGNIRNGYFYRVDNVTYVDGSAQLISDPAFGTIRSPLVAEWIVNGQSITTVNVHLTARSNSDPLWGSDQPPSNAGDGARTSQLAAVGEWINDQLATNPDLRLAVVGDFNGFYFEGSQTQLTDGGVLTNLATLLPEEERYSYIFEGNSQLIDNILVTSNLTAGASYDAVHINAEFTTRPTDHDPQVARLVLGTTPYDLVLTNVSVAENAAAGAVVGTASASDSARDSLNYTLTNDAGGLFEINVETGVITTTAPLDRETTPSYDIIVRATDTGGNFVDRVVTITVANVNEAPGALDDGASVNEDEQTANLWSQLLGNDVDPDLGDTLTIVSVDTEGTMGSVLFDPTTQSLVYVADGEEFDELADGASLVDTFTYTVRDAAGLTSTATVTMTVTGIDDGLTIDAGTANDELIGSAGEDWLAGNNGNDVINGFAGNDRLLGGNGDDFLFGGAGNDMLIGGRGDDVLEGGAGTDRFIFGKAAGNDIVTDFDVDRDILVLGEGQSVHSTNVGDLNLDGVDDLFIQLSRGGTITMYGVSSLEGLTMSTGMTIDMSAPAAAASKVAMSPVQDVIAIAQVTSMANGVDLPTGFGDWGIGW